MAQTKATSIGTRSSFLHDGQEIEWRLIRSQVAKRLRIKVGPAGVVVVLPEGRDGREAAAFVSANRAWVAEQWIRTRKLLATRRPKHRTHGRILFRGKDTVVKVVRSDTFSGANRITCDQGAITITCGTAGRTSAARSLESWLRKQARQSIERNVAELAKRLKHAPNRIYVMGQRTKWGNCSALANLSFNWRLILAPDHVLRYIVTHEMVHLAVPDHSRKFWLTVQSLCPDSERSRQWLVSHEHQLRIDVNEHCA